MALGVRAYEHNAEALEAVFALDIPSPMREGWLTGKDCRLRK